MPDMILVIETDVLYRRATIDTDRFPNIAIIEVQTDDLEGQIHVSVNGERLKAQE